MKKTQEILQGFELILSKGACVVLERRIDGALLEAHDSSSRSRVMEALVDLMEAHRVVFKNSITTGFFAGRQEFVDAWTNAEKALIEQPQGSSVQDKTWEDAKVPTSLEEVIARNPVGRTFEVNQFNCRQLQMDLAFLLGMVKK